MHFHGLKLIGSICSSVLMTQTQKARPVLSVFNVETPV